ADPLCHVHYCKEERRTYPFAFTLLGVAPNQPVMRVVMMLRGSSKVPSPGRSQCQVGHVESDKLGEKFSASAK
ncbi:hypothetical protein EJB05_55677, partial [Eragrostis curvula]